ncbi:site-specific integrase [Deltaproteobacteria bacterium IMCC39524]|nr:site-specific integrase [Deltaproteobacteria bacterium IMCC39524]
MAQAKTLTQAEIDQVLRYVATTRYPARNRLLVLSSIWSGMRVGEIAALKISDVMNDEGNIKHEIRLTARQTKGHYARVVFLNEKLRVELAAFLSQRNTQNKSLPLFATEKSKGFSANTLTQWYYWTYKKAGISGASSHSGRRTFITSLAQKGIGVRVLASLAGHRSIAVTQVYIDVNDEMKRQAVELI